MENFHRFMGENEDTSATFDIKEFIKSLADQLNEGKDLSRLFMEKDVIHRNILGNAQGLLHLTSIDNKITEILSSYEEGNPFSKDIDQTTYTNVHSATARSIDTFININKLQEKFTGEALENARNRCMYNTFRVINFLTDLIYLNL